jgi:hypothetical protein
VFDSKGISAKSFSPNTEKVAYQPTKLSTDNGTPHIKYAFDFIEINDAISFIADKIDFPFLNEICGEGEIEVFLTSFKTYVYADETKDANKLQLYIPDDLIVFRGEWGIYSCMNNGGAVEYDDMGNMMSDLVGYSSHKRFNGNAIEKDLTPPIYQFFVKTENKVTSLACLSSDFVGVPGHSAQWTVLEGGDVVSSDKLFSTEELCDMPETSQQCTITEVGEDYFLVSGKYNLGKIYFDEYTLFFIKDQSAEPANFAVGDKITVTFNQLYEKYNPKVVVANIIKR